MAKVKADLTKVVNKLVSVFGEENVEVNDTYIVVTDGVYNTDIRIITFEGELHGFCVAGHNTIVQPTTIARYVKNNLEEERYTYPVVDEEYEEQPAAEQLIKAEETQVEEEVQPEVQPTEEAQPEETTRPKLNKYIHATRGTIHTLVRQIVDTKSVVVADENGEETEMKYITFNRWYRAITPVNKELFKRVYGYHPSERREERPTQATLDLSFPELEDEEAEAIFGTDDVVEIPTVDLPEVAEEKQDDLIGDYVQFIEPDGTVTTYSKVSNRWRQDLPVNPDIAYKVPEGTVLQMPWFTASNEYEDADTTVHCLDEALSINILTEVLEQRDAEGMLLDDLNVTEIVAEARHLREYSMQPESEIYQLLRAEEIDSHMYQHLTKQLQRLDEFIDKWQEVKF